MNILLIVIREALDLHTRQHKRYYYRGTLNVL